VLTASERLKELKKYEDHFLKKWEEQKLPIPRDLRLKVVKTQRSV
jgi:hypothetical protein